MNRIEPLTDELIAAAFERRAGRADRYDLGALRTGIITTSGAVQQRGRWSARLTGGRPMIAPRPVWVAIAVLAALLGLAVALLLVGQRPSNPFGNGLLAFVRDGDVYLARPDGSNAEVVLHQDGVTFVTVAWSPLGDRLAVDGGSGAVIIDAATGAATFIGGSNPVWAPDARELAVLDPGSDGASPPVAELRIVDAVTGATDRAYPFPAIGGLAWSPNGRWIAATGGVGARSNALVRIDVMTGQVAELDGASGMLDSTREPAWSPDSLHIAFIRWGDERLCRGGPLCETNVFVADADGSDAVRLNRVPATADEPIWSPDGQWIAYRQVDRSVNGSGAGAVADGATGIVIVHPDGTNERPIAAAGVGDVGWSPDSEHVRFIRSDGRGSAETIWESSLSGVAHAVVAALGPAPDLFERTGSRFAWQSLAASRDTPPLPGVSQPSLAPAIALVTPQPAASVDPSGTWPTLATVSGDGCRPMTVGTDTGTVEVLANLCDDVSQVDTWRWSPTGSAYAAIRAGTLAVVQRPGRVALNLAGLTGLTQLSWSPSGDRLAVTGTKSWLLRPDGSDLREIPGEATWSSDGKTLAVATPDGQLLVGRADASDLHAIGAFPMQLTWSPDASRFAFVRDGNVWTATRDGSDLHDVTSLPLGGAADVSWSPDGRLLAVDGRHGLWLVAPDGSGRRWIRLGPGDSINAMKWSPSSRRLAIEIDTQGVGALQRSSVVLVDPTGGPAIRIDDATDSSWSPDDRFLAVAVANTDAEGTRDLVLMNEDGSGRRALSMPPSIDPFVWIR